jgi:signal transduction histidine kinase
LRNLRPDTEWLQFVPPPSLSIAQLRGPCEDGEGGVTALANPAGGTETLWVGFDGQAWQVQPAGGDRIRHVWRAGDGTRWAATAEMLFQYDAARARWIESEEITARGYADVAVEPGGAFWLATADGLFRYAPALWRATDSTRAINSPVRCVAADLAGGFWFAADDALHCVSNNLRRDYPFPSDAAAALSSAGGLFPLKNGDVVLDTAEGPWLFRPAEEKFSPVAPDAAGRRLRVLGILPDGDVCVISAAPGDSTPARALAFDGRRLIDLPFTLPFGCNAAKLSSCFATPGGDFWLGTGDGVFLRHEQQWRAFTAAAEKTAPESPVCFCETSDGTTWCGAADQVWRFDGRDWLLSRAGLGRVNGLAATHDGSLWAASNLGVHRCTQGAWLENGVEEGLPSLAVRAICADNQGRLWAATTRGLGVFHPEAATEPPVPFISPLQDNQTAIPMGGTATLTFGAREKWRFTPIIRLLYSYRLDASDWSPFGDLNGISYANLAAGPHSFQVRAMDRNGNISKPAQLAFSVSPPWFEETRLLLVAIAGASIAVFFAGLAFNRHRRLLRSYAEVERKVAERTRQLDLAHRELLHAQKMNALGTLAAGIAHDFNNILSIIKGSAQIIEDNPANPEKILTRVDRIKTVVEQGSGIVKAMLGFSRESDAKPAPCDLNAVVEDTVKLLGDRFLRDVEVRFEPAPGLPAVASPRDFVQQILLNFIFNAAESMRDSKHVFLATLPLGRLPAGVVLPPDLAPAYVGITVRDEGCGIAPEVLPRIFEPFFTTKALSTRRGTGLGLSMVYELARKMGAGLAVQSEVNRGSTFTLILPLRSPPAGPGPPEAAGEIQTEHERTHHLDR